MHEQIVKIKDMCYNLINDQPFKQFLSLVLFIGNYLNAVNILSCHQMSWNIFHVMNENLNVLLILQGSYAGNASGFTLDTLPKLLDTRANKPRVTFLHFIVEVAQTNKNDILSFTKYTSALRDLSRYDNIIVLIVNLSNRLQ